MFRPEPHEPAGPELQAAAVAAMRVLVEVVIAAQAAGVAPPGDPMALVLTAWSTAHGAASLWVEGALTRALPMLASDPERVAEMVAGTLTNLMVAAAKP